MVAAADRAVAVLARRVGVPVASRGQRAWSVSVGGRSGHAVATSPRSASRLPGPPPPPRRPH